MSFIDQTFADAFESQRQSSPTINREATYLGDGLYAMYDGYHIYLSADTNTVYLEPDVVASFLRFLTKIEDSITRQQEAA